MQPSILLEIKNNIPHIFFINGESQFTRLTAIDENLEDILNNFGEKMNFPLDENSLEEKLNLLSEFLVDVNSINPIINTETQEFQIEDSIENIIDSIKLQQLKIIEEIDNRELKDELEIQNRGDTLATILDKIYAILIAKALLSAYELEINNIQFKSDINVPRFIEKMGEELDKLNIEFSIQNT